MKNDQHLNICIQNDRKQLRLRRMRGLMLLIVLSQLPLFGHADGNLPDRSQALMPDAMARVSPLLPARDMPPAPAELRVLSAPNEALRTMIQMIRSAESEISMSYFTIWPCAAVTHILLDEINKRREELRRQGKTLRVRMIFDPINYSRTLGLWLSHFNLRESIRYFEQQGVEVRLYNTEGLANRSHIKFFQVDGRTGISGSRNWEDVSFGLADDTNLTELDAQVTGPAADQMRRLLDLQWDSPIVSPPGLINLPTPDFGEDPRQTREELRKCLAELPQKHDFPDLMRRIEATPLPPVQQCQNVRVLSDLPHGYDQSRQIVPALSQMFARAHREVQMINYTFVPSGQMRSAFDRLARRSDLNVQLLTNGELDDVPGDIAILAHRRIAEFHPSNLNFQAAQTNDSHHDWATSASSRKILHAKVFIVDGQNTAVTSLNLDPLSIDMNLESGVFVEGCPAFAQAVQSEYNRLRSSSQSMSPDSPYGRCYQQRRDAVPWRERWIEEMMAELKKTFL